MTRQIEKPGQVADYGFRVDGRMSPSGDAKLGRRRVLTVSVPSGMPPSFVLMKVMGKVGWRYGMGARFRGRSRIEEWLM